jgi:hypothetical protein
MSASWGRKKVLGAHTEPMSSVMQRESGSLNAALEAADPRLALREAVRNLLRRGQSRTSVIGILAEFSEKIEGREREYVHENMDILEGWASAIAIDRFFDGLPDEVRPPSR